jgi:hypothetical protein
MRRFSPSNGSGPVRVVLVGRDRRFLHVACEFIARSGYRVVVTDRPCELLDIVDREGATVVVVDGSDYLATAVRSMTSIDGVQEHVGVVTVAEARELSPLTQPGVLPKWGSFTRLIREIERAHANRRALEPALAHA